MFSGIAFGPTVRGSGRGPNSCACAAPMEAMIAILTISAAENFGIDAPCSVNQLYDRQCLCVRRDHPQKLQPYGRNFVVRLTPSRFHVSEIDPCRGRREPIHVAIVTGGAKGIGRAVAHHLLEQQLARLRRRPRGFGRAPRISCAAPRRCGGRGRCRPGRDRQARGRRSAGAIRAARCGRVERGHHDPQEAAHASRSRSGTR